jgi:hypothetical protein
MGLVSVSVDVLIAEDVAHQLNFESQFGYRNFILIFGAEVA